MTSQRDDQVTFYDAAGGEETFTRLIHRFYQGVATDPVLRPMYPEEDLGPAEERFRLFIIQYWGGPRTYSEQRGHPRLRMRHFPFRIGAVERDHWLMHMRAAIDEIALPPHLEQPLWEYMVHAAHSMVNVPEEAGSPATVEEPTAITVTNEPRDGDDDGEAIRISLK